MSQSKESYRALLDFQEGYDVGTIYPRPCEGDEGLRIWPDGTNGESQYTYAVIESNTVLAMVRFTYSRPVGITPCFAIDYAVAKDARGSGLGIGVVRRGLAAMQRSFALYIPAFYVEMIVNEAETAGRAVAEANFDAPPIKEKDHHGRVALLYRKLISC